MQIVDLTILLTTTQLMMQVAILTKSYFPFKNLLKNFLNGFLIIKRKINEDKCHLVVSTNETTEIQIGDFSIKIVKVKSC